MLACRSGERGRRGLCSLAGAFFRPGATGPLSATWRALMASAARWASSSLSAPPAEALTCRGASCVCYAAEVPAAPTSTHAGGRGLTFRSPRFM
jgi:hypothetical protein